MNDDIEEALANMGTLCTDTITSISGTITAVLITETRTIYYNIEYSIDNRPYSVFIPSTRAQINE